ncbi:hypothetical protein CVT24_009513 [Panaeolus cyanescens]|uniref:Major facilitator superfamily (MFS) profile domain-containing protein n=1 Tax=Panaeolus cyanescens TaxID=181874 RepID=A0A409VYD2_9AGAR|nr:hypothetical protein CVT24_009513 [Panaeolus cyanescens]
MSSSSLPATPSSHRRQSDEKYAQDVSGENVTTKQDENARGGQNSTLVVGKHVNGNGDNGVEEKRSTIKSMMIVLTMSFSMMVNIAGVTTVSISLPTIQREMVLSEEQLQWVVSAYPLSSGCLLLMCGRLADLHGRKKTFLIGSFIMAVFNLGCGFAQNVIMLDVLRGLQGIGAAAVIPASLGILANSFPPSRARSLAFATYSAGAPIGAVFGTALGGVLSEFSKPTWRSGQFLLTGLTFLCFLTGLFSNDADKPSTETDRRVDWLGAALVSVGLILIVFVLSQGEIAPQKWSTPYIVGLLVAGVVFVVLFLGWQWFLEGMDASTVDETHLVDASEWAVCSHAWVGVYELVWLCCMDFLGGVVLSELYEIFRDADGGKVIADVSGGAFATAIASLLFAIIEPHASYWAYAFPSSVLAVMGADLVFSAGTLFIAKFSLPHEQSVSGALFNTMTQLGTAVGVTVTTVVYNSIHSKPRAQEDAILPYRAAFWTAFAFGIVATILGVVFFRGVGVVGTRRVKKEVEPESARDSSTEDEEEEDVKERS